jgi:hypothetical protein
LLPRTLSAIDGYTGSVTLYKDGDPIRVDDELFAAIASGKKKSTIRDGIRIVRPGSKLLIVAYDGRHIVKFVDSVTLKRFVDITELDAKHDGFQSKAQLTKTLKKYYQDLVDTDTITIIRFQ